MHTERRTNFRFLAAHSDFYTTVCDYWLLQTALHTLQLMHTGKPSCGTCNVSDQSCVCVRVVSNPTVPAKTNDPIGTSTSPHGAPECLPLVSANLNFLGHHHRRHQHQFSPRSGYRESLLPPPLIIATVQRLSISRGSHAGTVFRSPVPWPRPLSVVIISLFSPTSGPTLPTAEQNGSSISPPPPPPPLLYHVLTRRMH
ncbi:unnamed protein product [Protopolystoma xenopodis]|uniref:Uncharacterized protein n=1 Tax=Protopolystoma xenopodis TaxID=117903 RepID=A0A3S5BKX1_9PLAT|nr:unnamed protein product [Protopolystoma xenopodis]